MTTVTNTSKFVKNTLLHVVIATLFSVFGNEVKHGLSCLIITLDCFYQLHLVTSWYRDQDKIWLDGPLEVYADLTYVYHLKYEWLSLSVCSYVQNDLIWCALGNETNFYCKYTCSDIRQWCYHFNRTCCMFACIAFRSPTRVTSGETPVKLWNQCKHLTFIAALRELHNTVELLDQNLSQ